MSDKISVNDGIASMLASTGDQRGITKLRLLAKINELNNPAYQSPVGYRNKRGVEKKRGCLESGMWCSVMDTESTYRRSSPMKSRAYRAVDVNGVDVGAWLRERDESLVHAGLDIGKEFIFCTLRWSGDDFDRPWRARNPSDVGLR